MRKICKFGILSVILTLIVLFTACGHSEVESTILTTGPETVPTESTALPTIAPETTVPSEPAPETAALAAEQTEPVPETTVQSEPTEESAAPSELTVETTAPAEEGARDYVLNNNSKKFHYPSCSSVGQIKPSNRADFHGTRQELLDKGYSPCGRCKP